MPHNIWGLLIVGALLLLLFARPGRISNLMEDFGKGIRGFRKGLSDPQSETPPEDPPRQVRDRTEDRAQN